MLNSKKMRNRSCQFDGTHFYNDMFGQNRLDFLHIEHLYYKVGCVSLCQHSNVQMLSSPPILKLLDSQGCLWLPYDLTKIIKLIGVTFKQKNTLRHSFRISVIPSLSL